MVSTLFRREVKEEKLFGTRCRQRQADFQNMLDAKFPCERGLKNNILTGLQDVLLF